MKQVFTLFFLLIIIFQTKAEVIIEYSSTFNSSVEQEEWDVIRESGQSLYYWDFSGKISNPNDKYASHDYNVGGSETDTVRDWLVSPKLVYHKGAKCKFDYNLFSMMGSRMETDRFEVYYCPGDSDPYEATYTQIKDLSDSINGDEFTTTEFEMPYSDIPGAKDSCYLAFYYQSTNNWYVPGIDNIQIKYESSNVDDNDYNISVVSKSDNSSKYLEIKSDNKYYPFTVQIFDIFGKELFITELQANGMVSLNKFNNGVYLYKILYKGANIKSGKINL